MKKLLRELRKRVEEQTSCPSLHLCNYLMRNKYLKVTDILIHLDNLENHGYKYPELIDAIQQFYDMFADELFIRPQTEYFSQSDQRERNSRNSQSELRYFEKRFHGV